MKRIFKMVFCICAVMIFLVGCSEQPVEEQIKEDLVVGMELEHPPFETIDEGGNPSGISVEMAYALGEYLDRPVIIKDITYEELIPALSSGEIDLIISSMTITDSELESIKFSDPYAKSFLAMLVNIDSSVDEFDDLKQNGRKVVVKNGTTGYTYALNNLPKENIVIFDDQSDCVLEVAQGKADVFLYDPVTIYNDAQANSEKTRAIFEPFQDEFEYWGIAVNSDNDNMLVDINMFLNEFQSSGDMDKLSDYYLGGVKFLFKEQNIEFFFLN